MTGAHTDDAAALIADARERITALVRARMTVSARIQQARITPGGPRVNLSREMEILSRYHEPLGKHGTAWPCPCSSSAGAGVRHCGRRCPSHSSSQESVMATAT